MRQIYWLKEKQTVTSQNHDKRCFTNDDTSGKDVLKTQLKSLQDKIDENEKLIPVMEECIEFSSQNEKLKHQYSNYVANYCISKVNDEKIDNLSPYPPAKLVQFYCIGVDTTEWPKMQTVLASIRDMV